MICLHGILRTICNNCRTNKKVCVICGVEKLKSAFSQTGIIGKVKSRCKECDSLYMKAYRQENLQRITESEKERRRIKSGYYNRL